MKRPSNHGGSNAGRFKTTRLPIDHNVNIISFPSFRPLNVTALTVVVHNSIARHFDAVVEFLGEKISNKLAELLTGVTDFLKSS